MGNKRMPIHTQPPLETNVQQNYTSVPNPFLQTNLVFFLTTVTNNSDRTCKFTLIHL